MIEAYKTRLSPPAFRLLSLIQETPHTSRRALTDQLYPNRDGIDNIDKLIQRLRKKLHRLHAPFIIRSRQWAGYWLEPVREPAPLRDIIASGLKDDYSNTSFVNHLASNVLLALTEAGLSVEKLEGLLAGTYVVVPRESLRYVENAFASTMAFLDLFSPPINLAGGKEQQWWAAFDGVRLARHSLSINDAKDESRHD